MHTEKKVGRPTKPKCEQRLVNYNFKLTEAEYKEIREVIAALDISNAELLIAGTHLVRAKFIKK